MDEEKTDESNLYMRQQQAQRQHQQRFGVNRGGNS
jgi:hypothetical protein